MYKIGVFLSVFLISSTFCYSQQDPHFSTQAYVLEYYNPSLILNNNSQVLLLHRTQWVGYQSTNYSSGAPTGQLLLSRFTIPKINGSIGFTSYTDKLGPQNNVYIGVSPVFGIKVNNSKLFVGGRAGILNKSLSTDSYKYADKDDPNIPISSVSQLNPTFDAGLSWVGKQLIIGFGIRHLNKPTYSSFNSINGNAQFQLANHLYTTLAYKIKKDDLLFTPMLNFKSVSSLKGSSLEIGTNFSKNDKYLVGLFYRNLDAVLINAAYSLLQNKSLRLFYSLDFTLNGISAKQWTSHEFGLLFIFPEKSLKIKNTIKTPRYKIY